MANKIINTRIKLKYDLQSNWETNNPVLLAGEIAISTEVKDGKSVVKAKVGDGTTNYNNLEFISAAAFDVPAWAKAENKPTYSAAEVNAVPVTRTINGKALSEDITIEDSDTQYRLTFEGSTLKLQSKGKGDSTWSDIDGQSFNLPNTNTTYTFEEGTTNGAFVVNGSDNSTSTVKIHGLGSAAYTKSTDYDAAGTAQSLIDTLAVTDTAVDGQFVSSVSQEDGKITVARKALSANDLPAISADKITTGTFDIARIPDITLSKVTDAGTAAAATLETTGISSNGTTVPTTAQVKSYVDNAVGAINSFEYTIVASLPAASDDTMYKIYLVSDSTNSDAEDNYDEYVTLKVGEAYSWEKIGNTTLDLSGYVSTGTTVNGKELSSDITLTASDVGAATAADIATEIGKLSVTDTAVDTQFVTSVSEENGKIAVTRKALASTDIPNITIAQVTGLRDELDAAQGTLEFDGTYNGTTNKAATVATVTNAINDLDSSIEATEGNVLTGITLTNGKITGKKETPITDTVITTVNATNGLTGSIENSGKTLNVGISSVSTDLFVQGDNALIFDCGSSSN